MRLLYVCSDWGIAPDGTKGAAVHLRAITRALSTLGHEVSLLHPKGEPGDGHPVRALLQESCDTAEDAARPLRDWLAGGVDARKIDVVPNGVDPSEFAPLPPRDVIRAELGFSDAFLVGFAGSLKPWHGVDVLIRAFGAVANRDPAARLLVVGTGPAAAELRAAVAEKGLGNRVTFTGVVPHEEVPKLLRAMDVAVAPFLPMEDFYFSPIKLFEYMASGVYVVASRIGQIVEVIEDGADGLLCLPGDADDLAEQIDRARRSPALRSELGVRARAKVLDRYTWRHAADAMVDCVGIAQRARATRTALPRQTETTAA
jgi:glycosyltransferase involved in cell wall biosynthesis